MQVQLANRANRDIIRGMTHILRSFVVIGAAMAFLAGCMPANFLGEGQAQIILPSPRPTATAAPLQPALLPTMTRSPSPTASEVKGIPSPTPADPGQGAGTDAGALAGIGPGHYPTGVNPLTGLKVDEPALLERRPLLVQVENLPRDHRPQWGLSRADLVFESYTEFGTTRFSALYYGAEAERVGPVRSARFFDVNLVRMYKAIFAFGGAYKDVYDRLKASEFTDRLVVEETANCPPMCRYQTNGANLLVTSTRELTRYARQKGIEDDRQDLEGMSFLGFTATTGQPVDQIFLRFSGAVYNRWDYDASTGRWLRFVDTMDDLYQSHEIYAPLTDRLTGQQIAADNLVVLLAPYQYLIQTPTTEVLDIAFAGTGAAYAFRDGQGVALQWLRPAQDAVISLAYQDGSPYPFKPGQTWFEVMGVSTHLTQRGSAWRFAFSTP